MEAVTGVQAVVHMLYFLLLAAVVQADILALLAARVPSPVRRAVTDGA